MLFIKTWLVIAPVLFAAAAPPAVNPTDLVGDWHTECLISSTVSQSFELAFPVEGGCAEKTTTYNDSHCLNALFKSTTKSNFVLHNDHLSAEVLPVEAYLEFDTLPGVMAANTAPGTCHRTDWKVSEAKPVIGTECAPIQLSNLKINMPSPDLLSVTTCLPKQPCRTLDYHRNLPQ